MAYPTTPILDNFNRADGAIGSNWIAGFGDSIPAISTNAAKGATSGWYGAVWAPSGTPAIFGPDCEVRYTLTAGDTAGSQQAMVLARLTNPTNGSTFAGYSARIATSQPQIGKFTAGGGTYAALASGGAVTPAAGDGIGLECIGNVINLYYAPAGAWPGTPTLTFTDNSSPITGAGAIGVDWNQSAANSNGMEDFGGGSLASPAFAIPILLGPSYAAMRASTI
jgi:hypothetical protein